MAGITIPIGGDLRPFMRSVSQLNGEFRRISSMQRSASGSNGGAPGGMQLAGMGDVGRALQGLNAAGASAGALAGVAGALGAAAVAAGAFAIALKGSLMILREYAAYDGLVRSLKTLDGTAAATAERIATLRNVAKLPGLGFEEAVRGDVRLRSAGLSAAASEKALRAFGNALATVGGGKNELDGVILALTQIASKGKVSAEEINQLAERLPQMRMAMKAAFGTSDTEALGKLGITSEKFIERITSQLAKLPAVSGGAQNALENFEDSYKSLKVAMSETAVGAAGGFLDSVAKSARTLTRTLDDMKRSFGITVPGLAGKDGETEAARMGRVAAEKAEAASNEMAAQQREVDEANFWYWENLAQQKRELDRQAAAERLQQERENATAFQAIQERAYAARLTQEQNLQRQIAALQAAGPSGAAAVNAATNSAYRNELAERTVRIAELQKELATLRAAEEKKAEKADLRATANLSSTILTTSLGRVGGGGFGTTIIPIVTEAKKTNAILTKIERNTAQKSTPAKPIA